MKFVFGVFALRQL